MCLEQGDIVAATICDHVKPHKGDPDAFWGGPYQSLCKLHHDAAKQSEERGGHRIAIGTDGWPLPHQTTKNKK